MNEALRNLNQEQQEALDGSPAAVRDTAGYISIKFQCGPIAEHGVNGTSLENVLALVVERLEGFQAGPFSCDENLLALDCLRWAAWWLEKRTERRVAAGVEGSNAPH